MVVPVKTPGDALAFRLHFERRLLVRRHGFADAFDLAPLQSDDQVSRRADDVIRRAPRVTHFDQRLSALFHRPVDLGPKSGAHDWRAIGRCHLPVEPGGAVGVDLGFEVESGKHAQRHPSAPLGVIVGGALLEVSREAPMVGVDPLHDPRPAQRPPAFGHGFRHRRRSRRPEHGRGSPRR